MKQRMHSDEKFLTAFTIVWILGAIGTLAVWGVIIWAIIKLVNHYT